ncbi:MAG: hypothetical protein WCW64_08645, partial [Phycisphaerae bacterium]
IQTYITNGWITAYNGDSSAKVYVGYDSQTNTTHLWADKVLGTVGLYVYLPYVGQTADYNFWKNSGFNILEVAETGFYWRPDQLSVYYTNMRNKIADAKSHGFKVSVILLACMNQYGGPNESGNANPLCFSPDDAAKMSERLGYIQTAITNLSNADRFVFIPGDPGAVTNANTTVDDFIAMEQAVRAKVQQYAPNAAYMVSDWGLPEWQWPIVHSYETATYWIEKVDMAQYLVEQGVFGYECGAEVACDNYYRPLALTQYVTFGVTPELYPSASEVAALRTKAVKDIWAWPYDLTDDGVHQTQLEVRYIRDMVNKAKTLKLDGMTCNTDMDVWGRNESLNVYAFARLCVTDGMTSDQIIDEIAGLLATSATKATMVKILKFVENNSTWHLDMPAQYRLPNLDCGDVINATIALTQLDTVVANPDNPLPLPDTPASYISRIRTRLEWIRDH